MKNGFYITNNGNLYLIKKRLVYPCKKKVYTNTFRYSLIGDHRNNTQITGYYLGAKNFIVSKNVKLNSKLHFFDTEDGIVGVWGKLDLDAKLQHVKHGQMTRVTYIGKTSVHKCNTFIHKYLVEIDTSNNIVSSYKGSSVSMPISPLWRLN